ncbi:MAG: branched-chain amino acid ABC transporter permease [Bradyrhizobiaceae bacterium]|nr:MAG: branched-chain amino acid ABC transporter permease [Bradyrhizobiaceae bacterium]
MPNFFISAPDVEQHPFAYGIYNAATSLLAAALFANFIGLGALAHDAGFSLGWVLASTAFVWAAPAQIVLISSIHAGASILEAAVAVTLSAVRLLPMVIGLLPMMRMPKTKTYELLLPAHFTAVTFWVESYRLLVGVPRERRIVFANGLGTGFISISLVATALGYVLAGRLPPLFAAGVLALTPLVFLLSTAHNGTRFVDRAGLISGLILYPLVAIVLHTGVDILVSGLAAGTLTYVLHRYRRRRRVDPLDELTDE